MAGLSPAVGGRSVGKNESTQPRHLNRKNTSQHFLYNLSHYALLVLTQQYYGDQRASLKAFAQDCHSLPRKRRREVEDNLRRSTAKLAKYFALRARHEELLEVFSEATRGLDEIGSYLDARVHTVFIAVSDIRRLFEHYERAFPTISEMFPHEKLSIDVTGADQPRPVEIALLEGLMWVDMALLWNRASTLASAHVRHESRQEGDSSSLAIHCPRKLRLHRGLHPWHGPL